VKFGGVLRDRSFRLLWLGSTTSALGSAFTPVALAFAVLRIGGSAIALGLVLTSGALARLLFLLIGGVLADRLPRRRVMLVADVARGFIQASVAALLLTGQAQVWELLVANVMTSVASSFFRPASTGLIAQAVGPEQLQQANALLSISGSTASVLGPALSGVLVATIGPGWAFAVDGASFFGSGAFLGRMGALPSVRTHAGTFLDELREGWHAVTVRQWYWINLLAHASWNLAIAALFVLGPVVALHRFGGAAAWGAISAGLAVGSVAGGFVVLRARPHRPLVAGNLALTLGALPLLAVAFALPLPVIVVAAAVDFAGLGFLNGVWRTTLQQIIPPDVLARVNSYDLLISFAVMPIGYAAAGPIAAAIGVRATMIGAAVLTAVPCAAVVMLPGIRNVTRRADGTVSGAEAASL